MRVGFGDGEVGGEYAEDDMLHAKGFHKEKRKKKYDGKEWRYACGGEGSARLRVG
jgi:hypothetical protein